MAFTLKNIKTKTNPKIVAPSTPSEKIICEINHFIYKNEETGFFVFSAKLPANASNIQQIVNGKLFLGRTFTVVGTSLLVVETIKEKQEVECNGNFELGKNGQVQFNTVSIKELIPTKPKAIEIFLGCGKIHGIGPKIAKKIVNKYQSETISILDNEIEKLIEIEGITERKLEIIKTSWSAYRAIYEMLATMQLYGIGDGNGLKIFNYFKEKTLNIIQNDPYKLTEVPMIGFKTADRIAQAIGISHIDPQRIKYCILYTLEELSEKEGHTAYSYELLIEKVNEILSLDNNLVRKEALELIEKKELISKKIVIKKFTNQKQDTFILESVDGVSHKKMHNAEVKIAKELLRIFSHNINNEFKEKINQFITKNPYSLDESQKSAATNILNNKISILTGGPGTGKTHTIKSILSFYESINKKCILCAPTGRAAKRMEEATGRESSTIHRLLGFTEGKFKHNEINQLEGNVFIVDESSMIDIWLFCSLLKALPDHATLLMVGDIDQLPSVGAGIVLKDLIDSNCIPVSRLMTIHRQALNSQIILASHSIINKKVPELFDETTKSDFIFIEQNDNFDIQESIINLVNNLVSSHQFKKEEIQILTPRKDTELGTLTMNEKLRPFLNTSDILENNINGKRIKMCNGDRVMQFKNNYDLDVFNGDIGTVLATDNEENSILVNFDNKDIDISNNDINDLKLAYAITIHKSQGSDYPCIIIPISKSHTFLWDANLLYTAITRGKKQVYLVGDKKTLFYAVASFRQNHRVTSLKQEINTIFLETI